MSRRQLLKEIVRAIIHANQGKEATGKEGIIFLLLYFTLPPDTLVRNRNHSLVDSDHAVFAIRVSRVKALHKEAHLAVFGGPPAPLHIHCHGTVRNKAHAPIRQQLDLGHAVRAVSEKRQGEEKGGGNKNAKDGIRRN